MVFTNIFEGEEVREKVSRITDFSTALGSLLSMVCDGFGELQSDSVSQQLSIQGFVEKIQKHTEDIAGLHDYNVKQESNKDSHTNLMNELQQFILDFSTSSEQLRSEISNLRLTTKNELFATQGAMEKLFLEALEKMPAGGGAPTVSGGGVGKTIIVNAEGRSLVTLYIYMYRYIYMWCALGPVLTTEQMDRYSTCVYTPMLLSPR